MASSVCRVSGNVRRGRSVVAVLLVQVCVALLLSGCMERSEEKTYGNHNNDVPRECNSDAPWCKKWEKTYHDVLTWRGFDEFVGRCPGGESSFYDYGATETEGKYEWYCASRAKYFQRPRGATPLRLTGYSLLPSPSQYLASVAWQPGAFGRHVTFNADFYPLADGQCYVDFADEKVGGGVFRKGLAQEEKLMLQLPELLLVVRERSVKRQPLYLSSRTHSRSSTDIIVFKDALRRSRTIPKQVDLQCGWPPKSAWPCEQYAREQAADDASVTIIAVNAEDFSRDGYYDYDEFTFLADKMLGAFAAARESGCRSLNSGPLGAGVFNGNLDLAVLLHATMSVAFGMPVTMWGIRSASFNVRQIVGWIDEKPLTIRTVLRKLQRGISWSYGPRYSDQVQAIKSRWDRA
eukprot:TRINITY_DN11317_c0_g1_i1.p1 TRINITY_DN11317_c0_g1~~TRINITY_DN11317_c0_g1_i1.p1  ORF type:complete len:406 (+),score=55.99 TRINITY_DN11317_c0_g1_i1:145-1362(+)